MYCPYMVYDLSIVWCQKQFLIEILADNPRDGGAWWAAVSGVAQSWTRLK